MSQHFCFFSWSGNDLSGHFNALRIYGHRPLLSLDPNADGISYASALPTETITVLTGRAEVKGGGGGGRGGRGGGGLGLGG
jgi:hypothetical protein